MLRVIPKHLVIMYLHYLNPESPDVIEHVLEELSNPFSLEVKLPDDSWTSIGDNFRFSEREVKELREWYQTT